MAMGMRCGGERDGVWCVVYVWRVCLACWLCVGGEVGGRRRGRGSRWGLFGLGWEMSSAWGLSWWAAEWEDREGDGYEYGFDACSGSDRFDANISRRICPLNYPFF